MRLQGVTKRFGSTTAVDQLNLEIPSGSFTTLLGPSGCGKTTTLRMIAGFFDPDEGEIVIDGVRQNGLPPYKRNVSIVFQEYALFPHMTVAENIGYGLTVRKTPKAEQKRRIEEMAAILGLEGLEGRAPHQLSGGQQQRVALARSLVLEPDVLLMDEPMSNLDAKLRIRLRAELRSLQRRLGITTIYVTHDQEEALSLSDYVAVMDHGRLQQYSNPWDLYFRPNNQFVADFVGLANFLPAELLKVEGNQATVRVAGEEGELTLGDGSLNGARPKDAMTLVVRPEWAKLTPGNDQSSSKDALRLLGKVESVSFLGTIIRYFISVEGFESWLVVDSDASSTGEHFDGQVTVEVPWTRTHLLPAEERP